MEGLNNFIIEYKIHIPQACIQRIQCAKGNIPSKVSTDTYKAYDTGNYPALISKKDRMT